MGLTLNWFIRRSLAKQVRACDVTSLLLHLSLLSFDLFKFFFFFVSFSNNYSSLLSQWFLFRRLATLFSARFLSLSIYLYSFDCHFEMSPMVWLLWYHLKQGWMALFSETDEKTWKDRYESFAARGKRKLLASLSLSLIENWSFDQFLIL